MGEKMMEKASEKTSEKMMEKASEKTLERTLEKIWEKTSEKSTGKVLTEKMMVKRAAARKKDLWCLLLEHLCHHRLGKVSTTDRKAFLEAKKALKRASQTGSEVASFK